MHATRILMRALARPTIPDRFGNLWRYHSRSDRHSKIACWGVLFDLLKSSTALRNHAAEGRIAFGINHEMHDFRVNRKKNLDLVVCTPRSRHAQGSFKQLADRYDLRLSAEERADLDQLPDLIMSPVGAVRIALEAKACMTAHQRALPRLYDELNSSHMTIHGASDIAIAIGYVLVNAADTFISNDSNKYDLDAHPPVVSRHKQPRDAEMVVHKVQQIPRRGRLGEEGFDGLAVAVIEFANDETPPRIVTAPPAPAPGDIFHYESMVHRVGQLYDSRFRE